MADDRARDLLRLMAPGTQLRDGLDRIVQGRTGAVVVLGSNAVLTRISTGGFTIDAPCTATNLRELAKMDGAIVLDDTLQQVTHAGVHLMPDARTPTDEAGTRHRTADRVARQSDLPVVSVSASMGTIRLYDGGTPHLVRRPEYLMTRADQTLQALDRAGSRIDEALQRLTVAEVADKVTARDVGLVMARLELSHRLIDEAEGLAAELGTDGRLIAMQLSDVTSGFQGVTALLHSDYGIDGERVAALSDDDLHDDAAMAKAMRLTTQGNPDAPVRPKGIRQAHGLPRVPAAAAEALAAHFDGLPDMFAASQRDLAGIPGIGVRLARQIREGLTALAELAYDR